MDPPRFTQATLRSASPSGRPRDRHTVWTVGHSTRTIGEFLSLLSEHSIAFLADVRHFPTSWRTPWASKVALPAALAPHGIEYDHLEDLGGYRKARPDSVNTGWRNSGFRGYADHMVTEEFLRALDRLLEIAATRRTVVMCAEAVPWKCHRSLLSDAIVARRHEVVHILGPARTQAHRLTPFARIRGGRLTYPGARDKTFKGRSL